MKMKNLLKITILFLVLPVFAFGLSTQNSTQIPPSSGPQTPIASIGTAIASTGNFSTAYNPPDHSTIGTGDSRPKTLEISPTPTPTPILDLEQDLCTKAAKEVEASRIIIPAQAQTIKDQAELIKQYETFRIAQNDLLAEYRALVQLEKEARSADKIVAQKDEAIIADKDKQITELKNKKSSLWKRMGDVLIGAAIFAVLK